MLILIDHEHVAAIAKTLEYLPIDGVTTNPTILYREGKEPLEVLHAIKQLLPDLDFFGFEPHVLPRLDFRLDFQTASLRFGLLLHYDGGGIAGQRRTGKDAHGFAFP